MITTKHSIHGLTLVHYGSACYSPALSFPIKNYWSKPKGGLWLSPLGSTDSWRTFCEREGFMRSDFTQCFYVRLKPGVKVLVINDNTDLRGLPISSGGSLHYIDFEKLLSDGIGAVYLTELGQVRTRYTSLAAFPVGLYGWDCECVLVLDPDSIEPLNP